MKRDVCPKGCDLQGPPIPQEYIDAGYYSPGSTHYSRMIGMDGGRLGIYDGIVFWSCPDCGERWHRFPAEEKRIRAAVERLWKQWDDDEAVA